MIDVAGLPLKWAMSIRSLNLMISARLHSAFLLTMIPTPPAEALLSLRQADDVMKVCYDQAVHKKYTPD